MFEVITADIVEIVKLAGLLFRNISKKFDKQDYMKRVYALMAAINDKEFDVGNAYESEYVMNMFAKKHKISLYNDSLLFIANVAKSLSKGLQPFDILMLQDSTARDIRARYKNITLEPMIRTRKRQRNNAALELVPSVCIFDDIAQFPLMTTERAGQWIKDLFAETRRFMNTFIVAAQRHSLLNKSLRALTHTFFVGYSLIDDDLPHIAKEMPSNILAADDFLTLYKDSIKKFTFFVYNNKLGFDIIKLKK